MEYKVASMNFKDNSCNPDLEVADVMLAGVHIPFISPEIQAQFAALADTFILFSTLMQVRSRGYVKLSDSPDDLTFSIYQKASGFQ